MKNQPLSAYVKPLFAVVLSHFIFTTTGAAADYFAPNWHLGNVENQSRQWPADYAGTYEVIGAGSRMGNATKNRLTLDGVTISTDDDPATASANATDYIAGGAVNGGQATSNKLIGNNATLKGRTVYGGVALLDSIDNRLGTGGANYNQVSLTNSTVSKSSLGTGGDVVGGMTNYINGHADYNTVTLNNTTVANDVYGGRTNPHFLLPTDLDNASFTADYNNVSILNGSTVTGIVYGADGVLNAEGNSVLVDNSTVGEVYGVVGTTGSLLYENKVVLRNGAVADAAYAVKGTSVNAVANTLEIDNATINSGNLQAASVLLGSGASGPVNATVYDNVLQITNMSALSAAEVGTALNWSGSSNTNSLLLDTVSSLSVARGATSFGLFDINGLATCNLWSVPGSGDQSSSLAATSGFVYGGASADFTQQLNTLNVDLDTSIMEDTATGKLPDTYTDAVVPDVTILANVGSGGTTSDDNIVYIKDSNVTANVIGGMAAQVQQMDYATWTYTAPSSGTATADDPAKYTRTSVKKTGNLITTTVTDYKYDGSSVTTVSSSPTYAAATNFENAVFSASNNTVVLENSNITGTVYAGYVVGADLSMPNVTTSNNTVVLRGNTTLDDSTVIYGGNAYLGRTTNALVFDHVGNNGNFVTYKSKNQFQNFNDMWQINADLNTRINFDFNNLIALVNVDMQDVQEGSATIIKAKTTTDMSDIVQNGVVTDLIDDSVGLYNDKLGIYSFSLTGIKEDANTVGWVLHSVKDSANAEIYGQTPLAGVALAQKGQEYLDATMQQAWSTDAEINTFVGGGYDKTRYTTGSGFDLQTGIMQAGMWKKLSNNWLGGFFLKYAGGHYDTFPIKAKGDVSAYGGGLMTSLQYSETGRFEANVEAGYMRLDFKSEDLHSDLKTHSAYYGGMIGLVQTPVQYWDLFARLNYLHKNADSTTDNLEQKVKYDAVNSLMLRAGTEYEFGNINWGGLVPSVGASGIYEFDGESKVKVLGLSNSQASLKGFSGRGQLGLNYTSDDSFLPLTSKLIVFGQVGKRRGFGGEINLSFQF